MKNVGVGRDFSDWDWEKNANGDTADFMKFVSFFGHRIHIFWDISLNHAASM